MNLFKSIKNKKGVSGAVKASIIFLTLAFVIASVSYIVPAFADTPSTVSIIPNITASGINDQPFEATVTAGVGHTVYEFRIYESGDFSDLNCNAKTHWWGPYYGTNEFGNYCQWNAMSGYQIQPGNLDKFYFTMDSPDTECCRVMRTEPKDLELTWQPINIDICVDKTKPLTTKIYGDPHYPADINSGAPYPHYINSSTLITLTATNINSN